MNWKEHPYLFSNGKFKILTTYLDVTKFNGYYIESGSKWLLGHDLEEYLLDTCKLIARPISGMTDKELNEFSFPSNRITMDWLIEESEAGLIMLDTAMYLLSIGVYPFDQNHFKTGTVIDINEI